MRPSIKVKTPRGKLTRFDSTTVRIVSHLNMAPDAGFECERNDADPHYDFERRLLLAKILAGFVIVYYGISINSP